MKMLSDHYREKFGCKVYKLSLDGGFTCPNRDGTCGTRGCIFCAGDGSGAFAEGTCGNLLQQMEQAKRRVEAKNREGKYIAYSSLSRIPMPRQNICEGSTPRRLHPNTLWDFLSAPGRTVWRMR